MYVTHQACSLCHLACVGGGGGGGGTKLLVCTPLFTPRQSLQVLMVSKVGGGGAGYKLSLFDNLPSLPEKLSKSALKNKRKVESKQRARQQDTESGRSQEQQDAVSMATHVLGSASGGKSEGVSDKEKKLKNLKKVCLTR